MNIVFPPSKEIAKGFENFKPFRTLPDFNAPTRLSGSAALESELITNISNFITSEDRKLGLDVIGA